MSVIYLTHPAHGAKVAISEEEANYDESHGWMRYDPATSASTATETDDASPPVGNEFHRRARTRKRNAVKDVSE